MLCVLFIKACGDAIDDCTTCTQDGTSTKCTACATDMYPNADNTMCAGKCGIYFPLIYHSIGLVTIISCKGNGVISVNKFLPIREVKFSFKLSAY